MDSTFPLQSEISNLWIDRYKFSEPEVDFELEDSGMKELNHAEPCMAMA